MQEKLSRIISVLDVREIKLSLDVHRPHDDIRFQVFYDAFYRSG